MFPQFHIAIKPADKPIIIIISLHIINMFP